MRPEVLTHVAPAFLTVAAYVRSRCSTVLSFPGFLFANTAAFEASPASWHTRGVVEHERVIPRALPPYRVWASIGPSFESEPNNSLR